jgi:hypothetical protein
MGQITALGALAGREKAELDIVLSSAAFGRSPRLAHLLQYLCTKYFDGEADQIKEYNIAVDVLNRPESFDPAEDAIARVEVHRLRKKLKEYYETEGTDHVIRIVIPTGRYGPVFMTAAQVVADEELPSASYTEPAVPANGHGDNTAGERQDPGPKLPRYLKIGFMILSGASVLAVLSVRLWPVAGPSIDRTRAAITSTIPNQEPIIPPVAPISDEAVRILCGRRKPRADKFGYTWGADQYFEGGDYAEKPGLFLTRTTDPALFEGARTGSFSYNIPLKRGVYELHLYFAETSFGAGTPAGGGENSRVFHVAMDGKRILSDFDIVSDAGGAAVADERVFKDISPGPDGMLHIRFMSQRSQPMVSAIKVEPAQPHRLNPIRMVALDKPCMDSRRQTWMPDNFWSGGQIGSPPAKPEGARDSNLYTRERYGNFSYAIPVGEGDYAVTLHFAEKFWGLENPGGGGEGTRVFDVYCNGVALLRDLDIYKEAGGSRPLLKTFHGLKANAQGKLMLSFVPVRNYASVYAVEVIDESPL